jgi:hypothetical protein
MLANQPKTLPAPLATPEEDHKNVYRMTKMGVGWGMKLTHEGKNGEQ